MKKAVVIEIFVLIFLFVSVIWGIAYFRHKTIVKPNSYNIVFKDIDSIVKGSPVRFMGINVGHVLKLKRKDKYIICTIRVTKKGVEIPNGTRAKVAFNGLGGSKSVELLPPLTDDKEAKGIVALDSLRIHDFVSVVYDLKDVCNIINDFIQGIDPDKIIEEIKEFTNNGMVEDLDYGIQKLTDAKNSVEGSIQGAIKNENSIIKRVDLLQEAINNFLN